jgi:transcriptional regulator NrdR family protein
MNCPKCNGRTAVEKITRHDFYNQRIRCCASCNYSFHTIEIPKNLFEVVTLMQAKAAVELKTSSA